MRSRTFLIVISSLTLAAVIWLCPEQATACPTCKQGLAGEHQEGLQVGFYWSIVLMMSMPFAILGGLSSLFYLSIRKARRQQSLALQAE